MVLGILTDKFFLPVLAQLQDVGPGRVLLWGRGLC